MGLIRKGIMKDYWGQKDGHKIRHHFQLFLHKLVFSSYRQLSVFHRLKKTVQNYKRFKQLHNIVASNFKIFMSQNSRFLLTRVCLVLKVGGQQYKIPQTNTITDVASSCFVYPKARLVVDMNFII